MQGMNSEQHPDGHMLVCNSMLNTDEIKTEPYDENYYQSAAVDNHVHVLDYD